LENRFDYRRAAIDPLRCSRLKQDLLGLLYGVRTLRYSPSGLRGSTIVAAWKLAQRTITIDAARHMGPRSVLCCRYVLELEIFLHGADDLFRRRHHLLYLRGLDRWKAIVPKLTALQAAPNQFARSLRLYGLADAAAEAAGGALPAGNTPAPESGAGETAGEV
jgi:hypothetical protein